MLSKRQFQRLRRIGKLAHELLNEQGNGATRRASAKRARRSGDELIAFRRMIMAERKKGVPVSALAEKHGVTTAYIYNMK